MNLKPPDNVLPEEWVDEIEKAFWGLVAHWKRHPQSSEQCARDFEKVLREFKRPPSAFRCLSTRQAQVILLRMRGLSAKEIARQLNCSPKTAHSHAQSARKRLGLRTMAELFLYGAKHGLVTFDELNSKSA